MNVALTMGVSAMLAVLCGCNGHTGAGALGPGAATSVHESSCRRGKIVFVLVEKNAGNEQQAREQLEYERKRLKAEFAGSSQCEEHKAQKNKTYYTCRVLLSYSDKNAENYPKCDPLPVIPVVPGQSGALEADGDSSSPPPVIPVVPGQSCVLEVLPKDMHCEQLNGRNYFWKEEKCLDGCQQLSDREYGEYGRYATYCKSWHRADERLLQILAKAGGLRQSEEYAVYSGNDFFSWLNGQVQQVEPAEYRDLPMVFFCEKNP